MAPRELIEQLSLREFLGICNFVDLKYQAERTTQMDMGPTGSFAVAALRREVKFEVLSVQRHPAQLLVTVEDERGGHWYIDATCVMTKKVLEMTKRAA